MDEDVWADTDDPQDVQSLSRDAEVRRKRLHDVGYRSGVDDGKQVAAQQGFDIGFESGVGVGERLGRLRGVLHALSAMAQELNPDFQDKVRSLYEEFLEVEKPASVAMCFHAVSSVPDNAPTGAAIKFGELRVGTERWEGLASLVGLDLAGTSADDLNVRLDALERAADVVLSEL